MEKLEIEIPVSVDDKMYRTNKEHNIEVGTVTRVNIDAESYRKSTSAYTDKLSPAQENVRIRFSVQWEEYRDTERYSTDEIGSKLFPSKEALIKHIVGKI